ncbi:MAG: hypothetical protein JSV23_05580 [Promethearchaeota archaeon]|nr:MAG: hypothetical protein JSV23_05580 [Candidatus Lokiarchaeota archaeon]
MNFSDNTFGETREIRAFTKEEILEIKATLNKFKSGNTEDSVIDNYLKSKLYLSSDIFDTYSNYLEDLKDFTESYLLSIIKSNYFYLKTEILNELNLISNNLKNLSSNTRNIRRLTKNNLQLDDFLLIIDTLLDENDKLTSKIKQSQKEIESIFDDKILLWNKINRIKNLNFKLNNIPSNLKNWNEFKDLFIFIESLNEEFLRKRKKEKDMFLTFHFEEIYQYFLSKDENKIKFYFDLLHLLYTNNIFEEYTGEEFINILERKEVIQNLKNFIRPLLTQLIEDKLRDILVEIEDFNLKEKDLNINIKPLKDQKLSIVLPKIVDYYIVGLEKRFQEKIHDVIEAEKFEEIANFYYQKIDDFSSLINEIEDWVLNIESFLKPYENITLALRKIFSNVSSEIYRRKNEYLTFIKTVKDEESRVEVRKFVSDKISKVNDLIRIYEDEASLIIKEEFPQLKRIKEILNDYYVKIQKIKEEVYKKLDSVKSNDIDIYQVIKFWEDSLNRKRQQLTFLISLLLNKLFKSFKDLIEKEGFLFATITEITEQTENFEQLPLNFALSSFLSERLTEDELKERISEIKSKINQLNNSLGLYQVEISKLEKILTNRVKIRKGISDSDVQCTVCHKNINFVKDKVITCPFCASTYHYLCIAYWVSKYNSCPMCQNHFLVPHSEMFESEEDFKLE